ncbi:hypothetical protein ACFQAT_26065 [Undibacterium arcticum]|uniref:Uncharacterized protein n=1 Tax=Undibacterium arcticum TaxID=1762892 RepID=A0ABV7F8I5_9BURK
MNAKIIEMLEQEIKAHQLTTGKSERSVMFIQNGVRIQKPVAFDGYMFNIGGTYVAPKELETMRFELV